MSSRVRYLVKDLKHGSKPFAVYKEVDYGSGLRLEWVEAFRTIKLADELAERLNLQSDD